MCVTSIPSSPHLAVRCNAQSRARSAGRTGGDGPHIQHAHRSPQRPVESGVLCDGAETHVGNRTEPFQPCTARVGLCVGEIPLAGGGAVEPSQPSAGCSDTARAPRGGWLGAGTQHHPPGERAPARLAHGGAPPRKRALSPSGMHCCVQQPHQTHAHQKRDRKHNEATVSHARKRGKRRAAAAKRKPPQI